MNRFFIGIDPGFTGAVALYCPNADLLVVEDMPVIKEPKSGRTVLNNHRLFQLLRPSVPHVTAMLEMVSARVGQSSPATFRFGQGYGSIEMALAGHEIPTHYITPSKWKKYFGLSSDKGASRGLATQRFPAHASYFSRVKDDGRAEATLLALYAAETLPNP